MKIMKLSLPGFSPLDFFSKLERTEKKPAYFTSGEWVILAWNPTKTIRKSNASIFEALPKAKKRSSDTLPFLGGWIGFLDYDAEKNGGCFHQYNQALLWNGKEIFAVGGKKFIAEVHDIHGRISPSPQAHQRWKKGLGDEGWKPSMTRTQYAAAFKKIQKDIRNGEYYQLNLTYRLNAVSDCDHRLLFCDLLRRSPAPCASYVEDGDRAILSLSPERFVTTESGVITTCPIKGTRPRGKNPDEDVKFRDELLASEKEAAELNMISDLLRNDIGKVSKPGSVRVIGHRLLQKNPTVWHTVSVIEGRLLAGLSPIQALQSMFPGGSVTGCPKQAAMQRIAELESTPRGAYCGSMILLSDHGFLDSTILIRTIVAEKNRLMLGIGGGIVADSVLEDEWQETRQKAKAFLVHCSR